MPVKVSVVVPVYNPGPPIEDLIASLLRQSLPADAFETIFVDDGSTDGSGERLDALAGEHSQFRVLHIPNSGWPGLPRNLGIDSARGEYVYFVDHDDWIGDEALERLHAMAAQNGSDIVVGKMVGHGRAVPSQLFGASRDRVTLADFPPLTTSEPGRGDVLTPHKLFRKAFLDEHRIRFPEGRRRLEDHVFVMNAYFRARVISILADYVCYHWVRPPGGANAAHRRFDPRAYYDNVRGLLDLVAQNTGPGPFRDRLFRYWYQQKLLSRAGGAVLLGYAPDYRRVLVEEIRRLALERFGPAVVDGLPANLRVRSKLVHAGDLERLIALAHVESAIKAVVRVDDVGWESGQLNVRASGGLTYGDGTPLAFTRRGERLYWAPPVELGPEVTWKDREISGDLAGGRIDVSVRAREDRAEFLLPATSRLVRPEASDAGDHSVVAAACLDPLRAAAETPLARGTWDLIARVQMGGCVASTRLGSDRSAAIPALLPAAFVGDPVRVVIPYWTVEGNLSVDVDQSRKSLAERLTPQGAAVRTERSAVAFALSVPALFESSVRAAPVQLHAKRMGSTVRTVTVPATLSAVGADRSSSELDAALPVRKILPTHRFISPGSWKLAATIGSATRSLGLILDVSDRRALSVRRAPTDSRSSGEADIPAGLAERLLYHPSWRSRIPRRIRLGARAVLR